MDSFISWIGGKKLLRNAVCERFPVSGVEKYVEVFGGAAWILFHKEKHANLEVYNDINSHLVNLFKCVKHHPNAIKEELENTLNSREYYSNCKELYKSEALTDIQRAAKYFYMIRASFSSKVSTYGAKARDISNAEYLEAFKSRLKKVVIENKSFPSLIKQYDRSHTLFYCDPPYFGTERYYDTGDIPFDKAMHEQLADILRNIKGRVIVSYNNDDYIKELYHGFNIEEISRQNNLCLKAGQPQYQELLIRNY